MATINSNTKVTLTGSGTFNIAGQTQYWGGRFMEFLSFWNPHENPVVKLNIAMSGRDWDIAILRIVGSISATVTDSNSNARRIDTMQLGGNGNHVLTLRSTEVGSIAMADGHDRATIGAGNIGVLRMGFGNDTLTSGTGFIDMIDLGDGNNTATIGAGGARTLLGGGGIDRITLRGEVDYINTEGGNDRITTTSGWVGFIDAGRGKDVVTLGRGGADTILLGRDADIIHIKPQTDPTALVSINGGGGVSNSKNQDSDLISFADFSAGVTVDLRAGRATSAQGNFVLREMEHVTGGKGHDLLRGDGEANRLTGGTGRDTLEGGAGADTLVGGGGADRFVFTTKSDSTPRARDVISDFNRSQGDKIDLTRLDGNDRASGNQDLKFIGSSAFSGKAGELRAFTSGSATRIEADTNGDGRADFSLDLGNRVSLIGSDFLL
ncbi:calcium-binding protein [Gemmobacter serpentinus]|uniref:calcium-binding protein n=1 Tax=Gemmobacter serpentinus TaxID=2652247 RepID=UPI00124E1EEC|nr:calcium-binding protein [Gemmobacter serpentinus]